MDGWMDVLISLKYRLDGNLPFSQRCVHVSAKPLILRFFREQQRNVPKIKYTASVELIFCSFLRSCRDDDTMRICYGTECIPCKPFLEGRNMNGMCYSLLFSSIQ